MLVVACLFFIFQIVVTPFLSYVTCSRKYALLTNDREFDSYTNTSHNFDMMMVQ